MQIIGPKNYLANNKTKELHRPRAVLRTLHVITFKNQNNPNSWALRVLKGAKTAAKQI